MTERQTDRFLRRLVRSAVSYVPSESLLHLRRVRDVLSGSRVHEADFELLRHVDEPGLVVVDVGANRGQSIRSLRAVLTDPTIHAIEPNPALANLLRRQFANVDVHVYAVGLANTREDVELFLPRYGHTLYDTRAAMSRQRAASFLDEEFFWPFRDARASLQRKLVSVVRLDDLELRPHIMKIDVEGAVNDVLLGARATLEQARPLLLVEDPGRDSVELLTRIGYVPARYRLGHLELGETGAPNTFFLLPEHLSVLRDARVVVDADTGGA